MSLKKNISGLAISQIVTFIFPLIQLPYLTRVLGVELLGLIVLSMTISGIALVITEYGFGLSLTKLISDRKRTKRKIGSYLYQSLVIKSFLMIFAVIISLLLFGGSVSGEHNGFIILTIISVIINSFNPSWLFKGLEKKLHPCKTHNNHKMYNTFSDYISNQR